MDKFERAAARGEGMYVAVNYTFKRYIEDGFTNNTDNQLTKIAKKYGGVDFGAGSDFTTRDISFGFTDVGSALQFIEAVKKFAKKDKLKVTFDTQTLDEYYGIDDKLEIAFETLKDAAGMSRRSEYDDIAADDWNDEFVMKTMSNRGKKDDLYADNIFKFLKKHNIKYSQKGCLQHRVFTMKKSELMRVYELDPNA